MEHTIANQLFRLASRGSLREGGIDLTGEIPENFTSGTYDRAFSALKISFPWVAGCSLCVSTPIPYLSDDALCS